MERERVVSRQDKMTVAGVAKASDSAEQSKYSPPCEISLPHLESF